MLVQLALNNLSRTRSTIEVAHFRCFVSDRRGSLTRSRRNANLVSKKDVSVSLDAELFIGMQSEIQLTQFAGEVRSSLSEEPHKTQGEPLS